ncbi:ABC transporter permease [Georgenia ruanii]|uniref:FtsX-like permease family protein n=1 Tax=Georgenia ruanii TaxID=348442 RepID=A0A7J9UZ17_9MICO|nr:ABC transporter permease [Georgenia ruanii]MPV89881.1 FtsX-like permease family protein [Georgenia ruanii]
MLRLTLAQMRQSAVRLAAAGVAIVVGTAFVAATLLAGALIRDTTYRTVTASLGDADVVVRPTDAPLTAETVASIAALDGVAAADGVATLGGQLRAAGRQDAALLTAVAATERLDPFTVVAGHVPTANTEIAVTAASAERLGLAVGDPVRAEWDVFAADPAADGGGTWTSAGADLVLSGILADPPAIAAPGSAALVTRANLERWRAPDDTTGYDRVLVATDADPETVAHEIAQLGADVRTAQQEAEEQTRMLTGDTQTLTYLVLGFAAVAMFVAGLVIANTFQVLVAQRTRFLALLRCVGATTGQVHRSVLLEAVALGVVASVVGLVAGLALGQGALWVLHGADLGLEVAPTITVTPAVVAVPLLTGTVVTVLAALAPARSATRVRPLAALRPAAAPTARGGGRGRLWTAVALTGVGAVLLGAGAAVPHLPGLDGMSAIGLALMVGVLGGILSFAGVMVGAVFLVPRALRGLGRALTALAPRAWRPTVRLATVNATRNPRRTSATASALLIGVALVTMMATGAAGARASLGAALSAQFPVDVAVMSPEGPDAAFSVGQLEAVAATPGVAEAIPTPTAKAWLDSGSAATDTSVVALTAGDAATVVRDPGAFGVLADGVVLLGDDLATTLDVADGDEVTLAGQPTGDDAPAGATVTVRVLRDGGYLAVAEPATLARAGLAAPVGGAWARLDGDDAAGTVVAIQDALAAATTTTDPVPYVVGAAAERQQYEQIIDTLLAIVVGMLGVAVVIALIGVANTLSLSVIERRREHALLRATGLTRGQLRGVLATEGLLIAGVGALLGAVLGLVYGWAGTAVILGGTGDVVLAVPWLSLLGVGAVAALAGLLASVLPARSAVRTPPVAALAAE